MPETCDENCRTRPVEDACQLADLPEWTPEALEARQRRLAKRATHIWPIDF